MAKLLKQNKELPSGPAWGSSSGHRAGLGRRLLRERVGLVAALYLVGLILLAVFAPLASPHDPDASDLNKRLLPPSWLAGGLRDYPLGTDNLGRDILSRIFYGARISLLVASASMVFAATGGIVLGLLSGYYGSWVDAIVMRVGDMQLAFPSILLAIAIIATLGPSITNLVLVLGITGWVAYARLVRGQVLVVRVLEYVEAERALGAHDSRIIFRHILPNSLTPAVVLSSLQIGRLILAEASLSFLGLGVPPPNPSWGSMLSAGKEYLLTAWWLATFPGIFLTLTILSVNLLGDWLRDALDPRLLV